MAYLGHSRCAKCHYDLRSLPVPHRCPECGLPYDQRTHVWHDQRPFEGHRSLALGACTTILVLGHLITRFWSQGHVGPLRPYLLLVIGIAGMLFSLRWVLLRWAGMERWIAVTAEGLIVHYPVRGSVLTPWNDIVKVRHSPDGHRIFIKRQSAQREEWIRMLLLPEEVRWLVEAVDRARADAERAKLTAD